MSSPTLKMQPILAGAVAAVAAYSELPLLWALLATAGTSTSKATRMGTWSQQSKVKKNQDLGETAVE